MQRFAITVLLAASLAIPRSRGDDWPDFLGPNRNSRSDETGLNLAWDRSPPPVLWQCELGAGYAAPSVAEGRLLHFDRYGDANRLTCREAATGTEIWRYEYPTDFNDLLGFNNGPRASPVVSGKHVYIAGPEGELHCVGLADGQRAWKVDTFEKFHIVKNFFGVGSTPLVWRDLLIANVGGSPAGGPPDVYASGGRIRGNGSGVVAFDRLTGEVRWQATDELASYASPVIVEINGRPWCFVFARGGLVGLDPTSGKVDFQFPWRAKPLESVIASTPVVAGERVFISETYGPGSAVLEVSPGACEVVWQDEPRKRDKRMQLHWNTAVHADGYLYGSSGRRSQGAELRCVDFDTGKVQWSEPDLGRASLLYVDGRLICLSEDGGLRLLRATPAKYDELAKLELHDDALRPLLKYPAWTAPVLANGLLYVGCEGRLVCLDLRQTK